MKKYNIPFSNVIGHRESQNLAKSWGEKVSGWKTCPGTKINLVRFRKGLEKEK